MILAILFAVLGYRKAEATGRSKGLWAFLMIVIFIGVQLLAGVLLGIVIAIGIGAFGWSENMFDTYYWPMSFAGVALGIAVCSLVLWLLGRKTIENESAIPPSPDQFDLS